MKNFAILDQIEIYHKTIALIDIDITFNKVKGKTARKINFDEFQEALKLFSRKKYPSKSPTEAYVKLVRAVAQASVAPTIISNVKVLFIFI
jgi:hypothetical protein